MQHMYSPALPAQGKGGAHRAGAHPREIKTPAAVAYIIAQVLQPVHERLPQVWVCMVQVWGPPEVISCVC